jgi:hypothetical protein
MVRRGGIEDSVPHIVAVTAIAMAFGFKIDSALSDVRVWAEEYEPGLYAINLLQLDKDGTR